MIGCASLCKAVQSGAIQSPSSLLILNIDTSGVLEMGTWASLRAHLGSHVHILALSKGESERTLETAEAVGVAGLYPPDVDFRRLRQCISQSLQGEADFDPGLADRAKEILIGMHDEDTRIRVGGLSIDVRTRTLSRWGKAIRLTPLEFGLLLYPARNKGRVVSPSELLEAKWGDSARKGGTVDQVKGCIKRLCKKIEPIPGNPRYLRSVRGRGDFLHDFLADGPSNREA